jgi:transposase-like protein
MTGNEHRHWTAAEKLQIIEEARQTGQMVSEVCRQHQISPPQFYLWEKQARQGALEALRNRRPGRKPSDPTARLQQDISRLQGVVAELSTENLDLKRGLWASGADTTLPPRRRRS